MSFLDGFASAFTASYGAVSSRRSDRERTELGYKTLEETKRSSLVDEEVARGALDVSRGALDVSRDAQTLDESKWDEEKKYMPGKADALAAEATLNRANAGLVAEQTVTEAYQNTDEYREAVAAKMAADTGLAGAQGQLAASEAALNEYKLSDEGKQKIQEAQDALIRASDAGAEANLGQAAASRATADETNLKNQLTRAGPGLRGTISAQELLRPYFGDLPLSEVQDYMKSGDLPNRAIPEGETAPEPELNLSTRPSTSEDATPITPVNTGAPAPAPQYHGSLMYPPKPDPSNLAPLERGAGTAPVGAGPTAGPAVRPGAIPYTAGTEADPRYSPAYQAGTPPRAGEPRLPAPEQSKEFNDLRDDTVVGVDQISYQGGGQGNVIEAQGGTRRLPLNDRTRTMFEQASAATGLDVRVTSGAQPSSGPNRTGSHRHDHNVGSGDVQLIDRETGKPVSMATAEGQQKIIQFMRAARDAGATGFGAGPDYMGNTTIHVGFGSPSVWGAGGKAKNAPKWLVQGMSGGGGDRPSAIPEGTGVQPGVRGEKVASEAIEGERMPTPRGEVKSNVNRAVLVQNAVVAAKAGANQALQQAGFTGPAPAIAEAGRTASQRAFLTGAGAATPKEVANAKEAVQRALPAPVSNTELNLLTLASAYDWYTKVEGDPEKAKAVAAEIYQAYRRSNAQFMAMSQNLAKAGELGKAAQVAGKAYAFVPDGQEATIKQDGKNFLITIKDLATGTTKVEQLLTPDEMYANIMKWSPVDFDKQILRKAGETVPTDEFAAHSAQTAQAIPEAPPGTPPGTQPLTARGEIEGYAPVGGEAPRIPDVAQMTKEEMGPALDVTKLATANRDELRKATFGKEYTVAERESIDTEIAGAAENLPDKMQALTALFPNSPEKAASIIYAVQQMNPNVDAQTILSDLGDMAVGRNNFRVVGQTGETVSTQVPDSTVLNMPTNTFMTIWNAVIRKEQTAPTGPDNTARNADTAAERAAAEAAPRAIPVPTSRTGQPMTPQSGASRTGQPMFSPVPVQQAIPTSRANPVYQPPQRRLNGSGSRTGVR